MILTTAKKLVHNTLLCMIFIYFCLYFKVFTFLSVLLPCILSRFSKITKNWFGEVINNVNRKTFTKICSSDSPQPKLLGYTAYKHI